MRGPWLFVFRRRPRFRISPIWERPSDSTYEYLLRDQGFITAEDIPPRTPEAPACDCIVQDTKDLEQTLLPTFFEFDQLAVHYQNRYYLAFWEFTWGALLVIVLSSLLLFYEASYRFDDTEWNILVLLLAVFMGGFVLLVLYSVSKDIRGELQSKWVKSRRLAEALRMAYYRYLMHVTPYNEPDRLQRLQEFVYSIRVQGQDQVPVASDLPKRPIQQNDHKPHEVQFLLDFYDKRRIDYMYTYYRRRIQEYEANAQFTTDASLLLLIVGCITALMFVLVRVSPLLVLAVTSAGAALALTVFRWLYGWEREVRIYRDTLAGLERVRIMAANVAELEPDEIAEMLPTLVAKAEDVFVRELNRWGLQEGDVASYHSKDRIEIEPLFGTPPSDSQYDCEIFMIMPFAEEFLPIYNDVIIPQVKTNMLLNIKRGDDFFSDQAIMSDIWGAIYASRMVIAECTGRNANVFYELGIAHTLGKPAILITQQLEDTPFDLRHLRIIVYKDTDEGREALKQQLERAITMLYSTAD
jgi:hypothetical protein